ncbi:MAG: ATP-binding cassette domain-containing protein [Desulfobacterales bacterium]|nr:ATP-binding cassette domain-containing protein [Desulfobacterales bacterium]
MQDNSEKSLLRIDQLRVHFTIREGLIKRRRVTVQAVSDVSLALNRGNVVGLVGESGRGKTTLGRAVVGLAPVTTGRIDFDGQNIVGLRGREARERARRIQFYFRKNSIRSAVPIPASTHRLLAAGVKPPTEKKAGRTFFLGKTRLYSSSFSMKSLTFPTPVFDSVFFTSNSATRPQEDSACTSISMFFPSFR